MLPSARMAELNPDESSLIGFQDASMHAIILAASIIMATRHLGVLTTMHTPFLHPTQIARFGSHLDWLSGGRWG